MPRDMEQEQNHKTRAVYGTGAKECGLNCICILCKRRRNQMKTGKYRMFLQGDDKVIAPYKPDVEQDLLILEDGIAEIVYKDENLPEKE